MKEGCAEHLWCSSVLFLGLTGSNRGTCFIILCACVQYGLTWLLSGKESACNAGDTVSIPGSERPPGEGNGNPLQYSCLENPMDRGAWRAAVHGVVRSQTGLCD